ncbi:MAG: Rho termination factor N-terminal domain-containing protein [Nitriliruptorales bacterium]|nr:Rho termination factor N-terminal domain-containing protein [Nitriliruptorales bacterium]
MRDQIKDASKLAAKAVSETGYALIGLGSKLVETVTDEDTPRKVTAAGTRTVDATRDATRQAGFALTRGFLSLADRGRQVLPPSKVQDTAERGAEEVKRQTTEAKETASATATDVKTDVSSKDYGDMTVAELREEARKAGIEGRSNMNKGLLIAALKRKSAKTSG